MAFRDKDSAFGRQIVSNAPSAPSFRFGSSASRGKQKVTAQAGPGSYKSASAMGSQALSSKKTAPASKFGTSKRNVGNSKVTQTGPGEYAVGSTIGRQEVSTRKSLPSWSFGSSNRDKKSEAVGASTMVGQVSSLGKQAAAHLPSAPACSLSGRVKFGSIMGKETLGPGPGGSLGESAIGNQASSTRKSSASFGFGTSGRNDKDFNASRTPGPGQYAAPSLIGTISDSTKPSAAQFSLRSREKFGSTIDSSESAKMPGPGAYSLENKPFSSGRTPKAFSFGKRLGKSKRSDTPGPGRYKAAKPKKGGFYSFGQEKRERGRQRDTGAGPGEYAQASAIGKQLSSTRPSSSSYSFGSAPQRPKMRSLSGGAPGPGSYTTESAIGKQVSSRLRTAPAAGLAGRTRFGSVYT